MLFPPSICRRSRLARNISTRLPRHPSSPSPNLVICLAPHLAYPLSQVHLSPPVCPFPQASTALPNRWTPPGVKPDTGEQWRWPPAKDPILRPIKRNLIFAASGHSTSSCPHFPASALVLHRPVIWDQSAPSAGMILARSPEILPFPGGAQHRPGRRAALRSPKQTVECPAELARCELARLPQSGGRSLDLPATGSWPGWHLRKKALGPAHGQALRAVEGTWGPKLPPLSPASRTGRVASSSCLLLLASLACPVPSLLCPCSHSSPSLTPLLSTPTHGLDEQEIAHAARHRQTPRPLADTPTFFPLSPVLFDHPPSRGPTTRLPAAV